MVFIASQVVSLFGSSLVQYAITWHITLETQSGIWATLSILCGFVPMFLLSPFAGVWADRYNKKILIAIADGGIALCTLALAVSFLLGYNYLWLLLVASAIRSLGSAVQTPAVSALLPDIVPEAQLTRVNGINSSLQSITMLASPMLSGVLMGLASLESIFFIDVITAALAIVILLAFLRLPQKPGTKAQPQSYWREMKLGFGYIAKRRYLRNFFGYCALVYLLASPISFLTPLQVARTYGGEVWRLTGIEVAFAVGMAVGGLVIAAWGGFRNKVDTMALALAVMGLGTFALGLPMNFWVYLCIMAGIGIFLPAYNTPATVLLQERVEPAYLGRVFGVQTMLSTSVMPLGMLFFGPLADAVAIELLLMVTGVLMALVFILVRRDKALRAAGRPAEPE